MNNIGNYAIGSLFKHLATGRTLQLLKKNRPPNRFFKDQLLLEFMDLDTGKFVDNPDVSELEPFIGVPRIPALYPLDLFVLLALWFDRALDSDEYGVDEELETCYDRLKAQGLVAEGEYGMALSEKGTTRTRHLAKLLDSDLSPRHPSDPGSCPKTCDICGEAKPLGNHAGCPQWLCSDCDRKISHRLDDVEERLRGNRNTADKLSGQDFFLLAEAKQRGAVELRTNAGSWVPAEEDGYLMGGVAYRLKPGGRLFPGFERWDRPEGGAQ